MSWPKGKSPSPEHRLKLSNALKGRKMSDKWRSKMLGHPFWGKRNYTMCEEAKHNIRDGIRARRYTPEYAKKLSNTKLGTRNPRSKLTDDQVIEIRRLREEGMTQQALADKFGVGRPTIQDIVNFKTWKHI